MDVYLLTPPKKNWRKEEVGSGRALQQRVKTQVARAMALSVNSKWVDELGIAVIAPGIRRPVFAIRLAD